MKYKKILFLSLLALNFFACSDLKEDPIALLSPEGFFKTKSDVEAAIYGAYGMMADQRYWGRKQSITLMLASDMADIGNTATPARRVQINEFESDATNGMVADFWPQSYKIISAANNAIYGAEIISADDDTRNALKAEAMFARSLVYFNLVRQFGDIPYIGEMVTDPEAVAEISKTSAEDVYLNIIADLEFGKKYLPMTQDTRARASSGSAATMLADVYLTLGNYEKAYENAKWVIDNSGDLEYGLESDYQNLFDANLQDAQNEPVFVIDFLGQQSGSGSDAAFNEGDDLLGPLTGVRGVDVEGWAVAVPSMAVYKSWDDRDYRKSVAFTTEAELDGTMIPYTEFPYEARPHIAKYTRYMGNATDSKRYSDFNYAIYRYAEVLLIAAEAGNEVNGGPNAELEGYVNQVRERARNAAGVLNTFPEDVQSGLSQDDFRDLVLEERRLELSFEFKRWWDIQRRDMGDEVFKGANSLEPHDNFNPAYDYLLALPQDELDRNPNLLPQNPGY